MINTIFISVGKGVALAFLYRVVSFQVTFVALYIVVRIRVKEGVQER